MNFKKTLKVLAASVLLFGSVGLATSCGEENNTTTDVAGMVLNQNGKVIREDFELANAYKGCALTWTSNNEDVAKINVAEDGTITCKITRPSSRTEVTLKATSGKYSKEYNIIVPAVDADEIADGYSFAHDKKTLTSGEYELESSTTYSGITANISWSIADDYKSYATISNGKLIVTAQEEVKDTVKLVAEFTVGSETSKITYTVYTMDSKPIDSVSSLETNKSYVLYINHKTKGTNYFFTGEMSGYYGATAEDINKGWDIYAEEVSGGYNLTFTDSSGKKQYINVVVSGSYVNFKVEDAASSVWTWDAEYKTVKTVATDGNTYYIGCTTKYATIQPFKDPAANYPLVFVEASKKSNNDVNAPKVDTEYKLYINQKGTSKDLYFKGSLNSSGYGEASENSSEGVDVKLEVNGSGYNMYFMDGTSKKYIVAEDGGKNSKGYQTYKFNISDSASCIWNYNATYDTMTTTVAENEVYIGTYSTFDTFSVSAISYAANSYPSHLVDLNKDDSEEEVDYTKVVSNLVASKAADDTMVYIEGFISTIKTGDTISYTINDYESGIVVYGLTNEDGSAISQTLKVGDVIKVYGKKTTFQQSENYSYPQIVDGKLLNYTAGTETTGFITYDSIKSIDTIGDNKTKSEETELVYSKDGLNVINKVGTYSNLCTNDDTKIRWYAGSTLTVSCENEFDVIVITADGNAVNSLRIKGATVYIKDKTYYIKFDSKVKEVTFANTHSSQIKITNVEIGTYTGIASDSPAGDSSEGGEESNLSVKLEFTAENRSYFVASEKAVYSQNGITVTNDKASYANNLGDYNNPARFYIGTTVKVEYTEEFNTIEITTNDGNKFTSDFTIEGATVTVDGTSCKIVFDSNVTSFEWTVAKQVRVVSMEIIKISE